MAPEQARGLEVDGRADQYALAVVGHRLLTGKLPFDGPPHSILYQHVFEPAPTVLNLRPDTPSDLRLALERALAKDASARFKTMEEFASIVSGERSGPTTVVSEPVRQPPGAAVAAGKSGGHHGAGVFVALATVALVVIAAWFALPRFQLIMERRAASPAGPAPTVAAPPVSKPAAVPQPVRRTQAAPTSPSPVVKSRATGKLRPVQYAALKVSSAPRGVLFIDGVKVGLTPVSNHRLGFGTHRLRIEQKGYQAVTETIVVKGTGPVTRRYNLQRKRGR
jgi:hypothetical protein